MAPGRNFASAAVIFEKAVELSGGKDGAASTCWQGIYDVLGCVDEAVLSERKGLNLAIEQNNAELERHLESNLEHYERNGGKLQ
jgi:hypothetical protein